MTRERDDLLPRLLGPAAAEVSCDECFDRLDAYVEAELLRAIRAGIARLTPHQRDTLVALTLQGVPIDVLAERRGTTRGALYKTLHDARRRLRAELAAGGYGPLP